MMRSSGTQQLARCLALALALSWASCDSHEPTWLDDPGSVDAQFPESLSELGLYQDGWESRSPHPRAAPYAPRYPLWSNGSTKERFLLLPESTSIDTTTERWTFPTGSMLFKTFAYIDADGLEHPVETRIMRAQADGEWEYAVYLWNAQRQDAALADITRSQPVMVDDAGEPLEHIVPSRRDCRTCHESDPSVVLGFDARQLGQALSEHATLFETLPTNSTEMPGRTADERAVLGYLYGNCVHCHNGEPGPSNSFNLLPEVALENLIGQPTMSSGSERGIRVVPGDADASVLYRAFAGESTFDMPPLGVQRRDAEARTLFRRWIEELNP